MTETRDRGGIAALIAWLAEDDYDKHIFHLCCALDERLPAVAWPTRTIAECSASLASVCVPAAAPLVHSMRPSATRKHWRQRTTGAEGSSEPDTVHHAIVQQHSFAADRATLMHLHKVCVQPTRSMHGLKFVLAALMSDERHAARMSLDDLLRWFEDVYRPAPQDDPAIISFVSILIHSLGKVPGRESDVEALWHMIGGDAIVALNDDARSKQPSSFEWLNNAQVSVVLCSNIMSFLAQQRRVDKMRDVLDAMIAHGGELAPDEIVFSTMLAALIRSRRLDDALALVDKHREHMGSSCVGQVTDALIKARRESEAYELFESFPEVPMSIVSVSTAINAFTGHAVRCCERGEMEREELGDAIVAYFERLRERQRTLQSVRLNVANYNMLFSVLRRPQVDRADLMWQVFNRDFATPGRGRDQTKMSPNFSTYATLMSALVPLGDLERIDTLVAQMKRAKMYGDGSVVTSMVITAASRARQFKRAQAEWAKYERQCQQARRTAAVETFVAMLDACGVARDLNAMMQVWRSPIASDRAAWWRFNVNVYTTALQAFFYCRSANGMVHVLGKFEKNYGPSLRPTGKMATTLYRLMLSIRSTFERAAVELLALDPTATIEAPRTDYLRIGDGDYGSSGALLMTDRVRDAQRLAAADKRSAAAMRSVLRHSLKGAQVGAFFNMYRLLRSVVRERNQQASKSKKRGKQ
eukprot:TRINITY_DN3297_c0_g1_i1.p1 TRINITY_DN3297_c0_g1~~TRINITY_DN3297_c0_g1_i1.p1  ORF type:complete len:801 (-),score=361.85 TRINITY_DN3297_c0_g1_i1:128-2224(-)